MESKEKYRLLCKTKTNLPIFMQDWWLDAVTQNNWDVILVEQGDAIVSALPYFLHKRMGFKTIMPPLLTPINGIYVSLPQNLNTASLISAQNKIMSFFAQKIDELGVDFYSQHFDKQITNWYGFYWRGFTQTTHYTYIIKDISNTDKVFSSFKSSTRNHIRVAEKKLSITQDISIEDFYRVNAMTFQRQGLQPPYSESFLSSLYVAAKAKAAVCLYAAKDDSGNIHAVQMVVWDSECCYNLILGANPQFVSSSATSSLVWNSIQKASEQGLKSYDFEGSMMKNVESFFRDFGGELVPYFVIEKRYSHLYSLLRSFKSIKHKK